MVAAQRDDQVGGQVLVVDLGGAVRAGIAVLAQHGRARSSAGSPACQPPVPALVTRTSSDRPRSVDLVGEHLLRHRRPADVARADEGDVQRAQTPSTSRRSSTVETCASALDCMRTREIVAPVTPADDDGVDAVLGRALDVVGPVADHQHPVGQRVQLGECVRDHIGLGRPWSRRRWRRR